MFTTTASRSGRRILGFMGASVSKSADQTGADFTTATKVTWNLVNQDFGGWYNSIFPTRLTVPPGVREVDISAMVQITLITASVFSSLQLYKNGSGNFRGGPAMQSSSLGFAEREFNLGATGVPVIAGDYFEVEVFVQTDTSVSLIALTSGFNIKACG